MKVYSSPSTASTVIGQLPSFDKVTRSKMERGYAYVTSSKSGVSGWVNNAQLLWRVPNAQPAAVAPGVEAPSGEVSPAIAVPPTATPLEPTATPHEARPPRTPTATPAGIAPSIFDAY
jgi:hypothetical protein